MPPRPVVTVAGVNTYGEQAPKRIVLHVTEDDGDPSTLPTRAWGENGLGSTLAIGPQGQVFRFTPDNQISYSTGGANTGTLSIELTGFSNFSSKQWAARQAQLGAAAHVIAAWATAYNIPIRLDTDSGISTHAMQSKIHPESEGHMDPGENFPLNQLLARARSIAKASGGEAAKWLEGRKDDAPYHTVSQTTPSHTSWNHPGVVRGVVEAFYDPLGSWDLQSNPTHPWGGAIGNHDKHVHVSVEDPESMVFLIKVAQSMGLSVSENPYVDPNMDGDHVTDSYHYRNFDGLYNGKKLGMGLDVGSQYGTPQQMARFYKFVTKKGQGDKLPGQVPEIHYSNGAKPTYTPSGGPSTESRLNKPFMEMVLRGLSAPVTESNMRFMAAWAAFENTAAKNNPIATTLQMHDANGREQFTYLPGNPDGVKEYPTPEVGVNATVDTINDYPAIMRILRGGDASRMVVGNRAVYAELNLWGGGGRGKPYATAYTRGVESKLRSVDPYANPKSVTAGDYPNMETPENTPATAKPPPSDRNDIFPNVMVSARASVPGWTPNLIAPGMIHDRSGTDFVHANMLSDVWSQVADQENADQSTMRLRDMYRV